MHFRLHTMMLGTVLTLTFCGCTRTRYVYVGPNGEQYVSDSPSDQRLVLDEIHTTKDGSGATEGQWSTPVYGGRANANGIVRGTGIESRNGVRTVTLWGEPHDVNWPAADGPVHFVLKRPAGTFAFDGACNGTFASGTWRFEPERAFVDEMATLFGTPPTAERLFDLALNGFDAAYARALYAAGYRFSMDDILSLQRSGVGTGYAVDLHEAGYTLDTHDIIMLRNSGVDASYARQLRAGGMELSAQDIVVLRNSAVDASFAVAVRRSGIAEGIGQIVQLRNAGINMDYVNELATAGYHFSAQDVVKLHNSGVGAGYSAALRKGGYQLSAGDLIRLHNGGVDPAYAIALIVPSRSNLSVDEIIRLRNRGLDAETIRRLRE